MIVKVQSPMADPGAMWLVCSEDNAKVVLVDVGRVPQPVQDAVQKGRGKAYFEATIERRTVTWGAQVEDGEW